MCINYFRVEYALALPIIVMTTPGAEQRARGGAETLFTKKNPWQKFFLAYQIKIFHFL